jgi:hypothetical protein
MPRQMLVNLAVAGNRLLPAALGIQADIVIAPGTKQHTTSALESAQQGAAFHAIVTSVTR